MTVGLETRPVHRACEKEDVCSFHSCAHRSFGPGSDPVSRDSADLPLGGM